MTLLRHAPRRRLAAFVRGVVNVQNFFGGLSFPPRPTREGMRFRYANEWAGCVVSLQHSFTAEQFEKFSPLSAKRPFGSTQVYDGFLEQLANSLKAYAEKLMGKTYNS